MAQTRLVAAGLAIALFAILGTTYGFLATSLNNTDPDIINIFCPDETTGVTRDHKWITREAVRRNIRQFFLDFPPPSKPDFNVPSSSSLTDLFHAYYGDDAKPARFIRAVNTIAAANVKADSAKQLRYDPDMQADAESFAGLQQGMALRYPQIMTSIIIDESYSAARSLIGLTFHSLQNFYSHSTWIEQGNLNIVDDLGLPGFPGFDNPAEPDEDVCTPCIKPYGACSGNVIAGAGLTTGYYTYVEEAADDILISKPKTGGKCSHGGVLDDSAASSAEGGINKDTASPCFSPHYYLHEQAAEMAVQATDHYLSVILEAVGAEKYRRLFDLYVGSALSITIDTTGSMGDDIEAVKAQVAEIVVNTPAELYVLVPFNDPDVGPVTKTTDPDVFLAAVNSLDADGGGDFPEMFWSGLQLALSNTPDFGEAFCFTDASAKDGEIMNGVIAVAIARQIKVTTVYSGSPTRIGGMQEQVLAVTEKPQRQVKRVYLRSDVITDIAEYQDLADSTGGLFISTSKFSITALTPILSAGIESSVVDVILLTGLTGDHTIDVPIDDSILDFELRITGSISTSHMTDPTGMVFNLMDQSSLEADPDVDVVVYLSTFITIRWNNLNYGEWKLHVDSSGTIGVTVTAKSNLNWQGGFSILDPSPPHPHYRNVEGSPLKNTIYYVNVLLIGYVTSNVKDVDRVDYTDESGVILRTIEYTGDLDDEFYIRSDPLPEESFFMRLYGHVHSGNAFCRLMPVRITAVQTALEVLATSEELSAAPDQTASGEFLVTNYGLESDFQISGTDDKGYITSMSSDIVHITTNGTASVIANFYVGVTERPGTVSIVTVTAQSLTQTNSLNSAVTHFIVSSDADIAPPVCVLDVEPNCTGYNYIDVCNQMNWTASATLRDEGSGLTTVYVKPDGFATDVSSFTPGTTSAVSVTHVSSCCLLEAQIIGVDGVGNVGKCKIDMGVLRDNDALTEEPSTSTTVKPEGPDERPRNSNLRNLNLQFQAIFD